MSCGRGQGGLTCGTTRQTLAMAACPPEGTAQGSAPGGSSASPPPHAGTPGEGDGWVRCYSQQKLQQQSFFMCFHRNFFLSQQQLFFLFIWIFPFSSSRLFYILCSCLGITSYAENLIFIPFLYVFMTLLPYKYDNTCVTSFFSLDIIPSCNQNIFPLPLQKDISSPSPPPLLFFYLQ